MNGSYVAVVEGERITATENDFAPHPAAHRLYTAIPTSEDKANLITVGFLTVDFFGCINILIRMAMHPNIVPKLRKRLAFFLLSVVLIVNSLIGAVGMAMAGSVDHHGSHQHGSHQHSHTEITSDHLEHASESHHEIASEHHGCCDHTHDGCSGTTFCNTHCSQPPPTVCKQPHSRFYLGYKLAATPSDSLMAVDPTRQFKPPRI